MDVVEIAPSYDSANGITAIMAGSLLVNVLGLMGSGRSHAQALGHDGYAVRGCRSTFILLIPIGVYRRQAGSG
jgi:hypothetical protein